MTKPNLKYIDESLRELAVPIDSLELDPENARKHPDNNRAATRASLASRGQVLPITVRLANRRVMTGNLTVEEARALGWTHVSAMFLDYTEEQAAAWAVAHNLGASLALWDDDQLAKTIRAYQDEIDWVDVGFEPDYLEGILADEAELPDEDEDEDENEDEDEDEIPVTPTEPITKLGEVIKLGRHTLHCCDCMDVLRSLPDNSVDAIVTDPPYGLSPDGRARTWDDIEAMRADGQSGPAGGFMGSAWDSGVPGITWARECLRVLKPGGHIVAFSATRTVHRLACAIEDAGFEIRDQVDWLTYQGFPKSLDVSKAIDEALGCEREVVGHRTDGAGNKGTEAVPFMPPDSSEFDITAPAPAHDLAKTWNGHGTALKPAVEPAVLARKPLDKIPPEEVADLLGQDLIWSRKAIDTDKKREKARERWGDVPDGAIEWRGRPLRTDVEGRIELRVDGEVVATREGLKYSSAAMQTVAINVLKWGTGSLNIDACRHADGDPAWPGPGEHLDLPARTTAVTGKGSGVGAEILGQWGEYRPPSSPFGRWPANVYHCPKPARRERDAGCEELDEIETMRYSEQGQGPKAQQTPRKPSLQRNHHSTVKPVRLMRQLATLVTPHGGTLLEPFGGSGTILPAVADLDCRVILAEREPKYMDIVRARGEWSLDPERKAPTTRPAGKPRTHPRDGDKR